jgi:hypothetical protein
MERRAKMAVEVKWRCPYRRPAIVQGSGTVREVLEDLDRKHPGIMDMVMVDGQITAS